MAMLVLDSSVQEQLIAERQASGVDRYDEVWEGVYFMPPIANDEHQGLVSRFCHVFWGIVGLSWSGWIRAGINVSDRRRGWKRNYRIPDIAVITPGGKAKNCGAYWVGGPDLVLEITSPFDRTREKIPFYSQIGVRELWLLDRSPWSLELYLPRKNELFLAGRSTARNENRLESKILEATMALIPGRPRPQVEVIHPETAGRWLV